MVEMMGDQKAVTRDESLAVNWDQHWVDQKVCRSVVKTGECWVVPTDPHLAAKSAVWTAGSWAEQTVDWKVLPMAVHWAEWRACKRVVPTAPSWAVQRGGRKADQTEHRWAANWVSHWAEKRAGSRAAMWGPRKAVNLASQTAVSRAVSRAGLTGD